MLERKITVFPFWTDNPYLNQLYLHAQSQGWRVKRLAGLENFLAELDTVGERDTVHVHWTSPIVQRAATEAEGRDRRLTFQDSVEGALARGAQLVWTIHNAMPHETRFVEEELLLLRFLSDRASIVHTLSPATAEIVSANYQLSPDKTISVPHSSYWGTYDHSVQRAEARARFGLSGDDKVVVFVGQLRAYKGIDTLLEVMGELARRDDSYILLLAGKTTPSDEEFISGLVPPDARVHREHRFIPDEEVPHWLRAGDVTILPYKNVLNSGSIFLAATFGLPVIAPAQPSFVRDFRGADWVRLVEDSATPSITLADAVEEVFADRQRMGAEAEAWARSYSPWEMSRRFTKNVLELLH